MKNKLQIILIILCIASSFVYININKSKAVPTLSNGVVSLDADAYNLLYNKDDLIVINIAGEIYEPDMYILENGATIKDAVDIAGGLTENADTKNVDFDKILDNKETIIIPAIKKEDTNNKLININTATKETLMSLPNIGDATAKNIIEYREKVSLFYNKSAIKNVKNIGKKTYDDIKDLITVD